jgi:hypothetical protein
MPANGGRSQAAAHQKLDPLKLELAKPFAPVDGALIALSREGQPVAVTREQSDLVGSEARFRDAFGGLRCAARGLADPVVS